MTISGKIGTGLRNNTGGPALIEEVESLCCSELRTSRVVDSGVCDTEPVGRTCGDKTGGGVVAVECAGDSDGGLAADVDDKDDDDVRDSGNLWEGVISGDCSTVVDAGDNIDIGVVAIDGTCCW